MNIRAKIFGGTALDEEPLIPAKKPKGARFDQLDSISPKRETRQRCDSRHEDRHRLVGEHAWITYNGEDHEVELINLSGGGAMISGPFEPLLWDRLDLHLGEHGTIECAVRWIREEHFGLEFAHETQLDWPSDEVAVILRNVIERTFPHIEFPQGEEPPVPPGPVDAENDHRRAPRHPLIWKGMLHHNFESSAVRIRNISSTGAMIQTDADVRVGSEPLLELSAAVAISATVQWAVGDQVGLSFHAPFDVDLLTHSMPSVSEGVKEDRWERLSLRELRVELEGFLKR